MPCGFQIYSTCKCPNDRVRPCRLRIRTGICGCKCTQQTGEEVWVCAQHEAIYGTNGREFVNGQDLATGEEMKTRNQRAVEDTKKEMESERRKLESQELLRQETERQNQHPFQDFVQHTSRRR